MAVDDGSENENFLRMLVLCEYYKLILLGFGFTLIRLFSRMTHRTGTFRQLKLFLRRYNVTSMATGYEVHSVSYWLRLHQLTLQTEQVSVLCSCGWAVRNDRTCLVLPVPV